MVITLAFFALPSAAAYIGPQKFNFPSDIFTANTELCNESLSTYRAAWQEAASFVDVAAKCNLHQECVLSNSSANSGAYMAGASILLGLTPVLLSTSGPSISETGLLSMNRPVLAALISLGTAAFYPSRVLGYTDDDPKTLLAEPVLLISSLAERLRNRRGLRYAISAAEYILVAAAIANVMLTSWNLGVSTIPNFQCQVSYLPLLWTILPLFIHIPVAVAFDISLRKRRREVGEGMARTTKNIGWASKMKTALKSEVDMSVAHSSLPPGTLDPNILIVIIHMLASVGGFVHVIVGILFYSSLLFAMVLDAAILLIRYFVSVLVCRLVLMLELEGIRYVNNRNKGTLSDAGEVADKSVGMSERGGE